MASFGVECGKELSRECFALAAVSRHHTRKHLPWHLGQLVNGNHVVLPSLCTLTQLVNVGIVKVRQVNERSIWKCNARILALLSPNEVSSEYLLELLDKATTSLLVSKRTTRDHCTKIWVCHKRLCHRKDKAK